jgi:osmotically inducible protein OsmC
MDRRAEAQWQGDLKTGKGSLATQSKVLNATPYSFRDRFEDGPNTNPEELLAAAHAGCFTMALSMVLGLEGLKAENLTTTCTVTLDKEGEGFAIKKSALKLSARVPGASKEAFDRAAQTAKENCPVSKLFDTEITLDAKLEG